MACGLGPGLGHSTSLGRGHCSAYTNSGERSARWLVLVASKDPDRWPRGKCGQRRVFLGVLLQLIGFALAVWHVQEPPGTHDSPPRGR